jgi:hypothetical protein
MASDEVEASQSGVEEGGGMGGPGAPTPLSALEVETPNSRLKVNY